MPEIDLQAAVNEMKRDALGHIFPTPGEMKERIPLITYLVGKHPNMYDLYCAAVEWEGWLAMEQKRKIDWKKLDPIDFFLSHSPSIGGKRAQQAVEIAKTEAPQVNTWSIMDLVKGKR